MAKGKTNAMRILDANKIHYELITYDVNDGKVDGVSVAEKINKEPASVFKTLVTVGTSKQHYVFIIPVQEELDLKKAAKAANEKKVEMIAVKDIQKLTGYIRGGCSPIGMKKLFPTIIDERAERIGTLVVSGGKIGMQVEISTANLLQTTRGTLADITQSH
ncbi:Cys-tRNA(Pro) deacylase [Cytobacillus purgationiresistens]|uniref:Cys-tRNA(Pro)/Cys-tRNA(Cys) deacylase n=1 Tax=Cytobacillus purgationiresistens TaxID=863449 RepID=A0ABU0AKN5_9BACI|nr:Cys-tRNA(Pro) deacylase [Cytobacillus purgationiresistens]MDQ0271825.1 Cys-tRNA(Pro)/Cys-tRNA(Cys) deacylase [Cytobacillus purgationiresistens]